MAVPLAKRGWCLIAKVQVIREIFQFTKKIDQFWISRCSNLGKLNIALSQSSISNEWGGVAEQRFTSAHQVPGSIPGQEHIFLPILT